MSSPTDTPHSPTPGSASRLTLDQLLEKSKAVGSGNGPQSIDPAIFDRLARPPEDLFSVNSARRVAEIDRQMAAAAEDIRAREEEKFALLRRQTVASEEALAAARRGEAEARRQAARAHSIARASLLAAAAGILLAAWPYISFWWQ